MFSEKRLYQEIGQKLKQGLVDGVYNIGDKLPAEREIANQFNVSRTVVREALIMLELENLITVKKGSGVYVTNLPDEKNTEENSFDTNEVGPFELLQARQLIESTIAGFAATQILKTDILKLRSILEEEKVCLTLSETGDDQFDEAFHIVIAKSTKNIVLESLLNELWQKRHTSKMWKNLQLKIADQSYKKQWLYDHEQILIALQNKNANAAKHAMWQHLENVKQTLMTLSDYEDPKFDGHLFESVPKKVVGE